MRSIPACLLATLAAWAFGSGTYAQCGSPGDCLAPHPTPGCADLACCQTVCATDPLCCSMDWDLECVQLANQLCVGLCGAEASGDCAVPHPTPSCDRRICCETVCAIDPFCCAQSWDFTCAFLASLQCPPDQPGVCGDPAAGSCTEPHSAPACEDAACCSFTCSLDPTCCSQSWDLVCVALATQYCVGACEPQCPTDSVAEQEDCGQDFNNPCYLTPSPFPSVQAIACGVWVCGQLTSNPGGFRDLDAYSVSVADPDGDGVTAVRLSLASSFAGFAALVPVPCGPLGSAVASVETDFCVELSGAVACVPPGEYWVVVAAGTFPNPGSPSLPCGQFGATRYRVRIECPPSGCGPVCGPGAGSCFEPRKQPGCEDAICCDAVCARDPACCDVQWDTGCVDAAQAACAEPPVNDECAAAMDVMGESVDVSTIGATASSPPFPTACGGTAVGADLWFRTVAPRTGILSVTTCGSGTFDSAIALYPGCGTKPIACNDDGSACIPENSSRVTINAICGETYLIRVGSIDGEPGMAQLRVTYGSGPGCACPGDFDGDRMVGASDLTLVLSAWGGAAGDLDGDGTTGASDLTLLLSAWGSCP